MKWQRCWANQLHDMVNCFLVLILNQLELLPSPGCSNSAAATMPSYANALWQLLLLLAVACSTPALAITPTELCPPVTIAASSNVTDLTPLTFQGRIADGRVWFVEFYAGGWAQLCSLGRDDPFSEC
jgi:hypothetical protein